MVQVKINAVSKWFLTNSSRPFLQRHPSPTHHRVFSQLNLHIDPGEKVMIVGPNGAGKTTLLKLVAGLLTPNEGEIHIGEDLSPRLLRKSLGIMLSTHLLYESLTGYQNLNYSANLFECEDIHKRIIHSATKWGIASYLELTVRSYSNGMRALLSIARANLHDPALLLLDEPTAFLDEIATARLMDFLKKSTQTVILTTQQPEKLKAIMNRVITL